MDLLKKSAEKFNEYIGYNYTFTTDCQLSVTVEFQAHQFYHLAGLHYLTDIVQLDKNRPGNSAVNIFKNILKNRVGQELIEKSSFYNNIHNRLSYLPKFDELISAKLIVDFDYTKLPETKILSRYLLYKQYEDACVILGLRYVSERDTYIPETFIVEYSDYYIKNQVTYDIIDIKTERIIRKRKNRNR